MKTLILLTFLLLIGCAENYNPVEIPPDKFEPVKAKQDISITLIQSEIDSITDEYNLEMNNWLIKNETEYYLRDVSLLIVDTVGIDYSDTLRLDFGCIRPDFSYELWLPYYYELSITWTR